MLSCVLDSTGFYKASEDSYALVRACVFVWVALESMSREPKWLLSMPRFDQTGQRDMAHMRASLSEKLMSFKCYFDGFSLKGIRTKARRNELKISKAL